MAYRFREVYGRLGHWALSVDGLGPRAWERGQPTVHKEQEPEPQTLWSLKHKSAKHPQYILKRKAWEITFAIFRLVDCMGIRLIYEGN